jgi:hypothetical protein
MKSLALFFVLLLFSFTGSAQSEVAIEEDPLKKPTVWSKLRTSPNNDQLWTDYFGKDLFTLSSQEIKLMRQCQSLISKLENQAEKQVELALMKRNGNVSKVYTAADLPQYYRHMVANVNLNFALIEEFFQEEFAAVGRDYVLFQEMHPNDGYSRIAWVSEQEAALLKYMNEKQKEVDMLQKLKEAQN